MAENMSDSEEDVKATYDELQSIDWVKISGFQYIIKLKVEGDGYRLMISDYIGLYGETMDEDGIVERFQLLNPYAEMLPTVILKHLKQAIENIAPVDPAHIKTVVKITYQCQKYYLDFKIRVSGMNYIFFLEAKRLRSYQFQAYIMNPTLRKALTLEEENIVLRRKVQELEGRYSSSSSSGCSEEKKLKSLCSAMKESSPPKSVITDAMLYLLNSKEKLPVCLSTANLSIREEYPASTSTSLHHRVNVSKNIATNIAYEEDNPEVNLKSCNTSEKLEDSDVSINVDGSEEDDEDADLDVDVWHRWSDNILTNVKNTNEASNPVSTKREITEDDGKEENASKSTPSLKLSSAKKKKYLRF